MVKKKTKEKSIKKVAKKASGKKITKKKVVKKKNTAMKVAEKKDTAMKVAKKKDAAKKVAKKKPTAKKIVKKKIAKKKVSKKTVAKKKTDQKKTSKTPTTKKKIRRRRGISVAEAAREAEVDNDGFVYINGRKVRMITTNGVFKKKKRTTSTKSEKPAEKLPLNLKTPLNAKQLRGYRERLMEYRARLLTDLSAIEKEALDANTDSSHMPIHMADVGSDAYDQDLKLGMAASERKRILDIEDALMRIRKKTYGVCHLTGKPILEARLRAKPWAKYTKESAEKIELLNLHR